LQVVAGDEYRVKLLGAPFEAYLIRVSEHVWIAKTIIPLHDKEVIIDEHEQKAEGQRTAEALR